MCLRSCRGSRGAAGLCLTVLLCAGVTGTGFSPSEHLAVHPVRGEAGHRSSFLQFTSSVLSLIPPSPRQESALARSSHSQCEDHQAWGDAWPRLPSSHRPPQPRGLETSGTAGAIPFSVMGCGF